MFKIIFSVHFLFCSIFFLMWQQNEQVGTEDYFENLFILSDENVSLTGYINKVI